MSWKSVFCHAYYMLARSGKIYKNKKENIIFPKKNIIKKMQCIRHIKIWNITKSTDGILKALTLKGNGPVM